MTSQPSLSLLAVLAVQLTLLLPDGAGRALDLSVQPEDVERSADSTQPDLRGEAGSQEPAPLGEPGWSVRPEVDLDVELAPDGTPGLGSLDPTIESLGLRLKRTW